MKTFTKYFLLAVQAFSLTIITNAQNWSITGNSGTTAGTNFLGTTDAKALMFKVYNTKAGYLDFDSTLGNTSFGWSGLFSNTSGFHNTCIGHMSLLKNTSGYYNVAAGNRALYANTSGNFNTAVGEVSLYSNTIGILNTAVGGESMTYNTTGGANTAVGVYALRFNTSGFYNTAIGESSLFSSTTGHSNTASGYYALYSNQTGYSNVAIGVKAMYKNVSGHNLVAIGDSALYNSNEDSAGASANTAIGSKALFANTTGLLNTATGFQSLNINTTGSGNTANGVYALNKNRTGINNTALGYNAGPTASKGNLNNTTALGYGTIPTASNQVRVGNNFVTSIGGQVGWTSFSDARIKNNIKENVPGLAFINLLRPVTYNFDIAKENELLGIKNGEDDKVADAGIEKINLTGFLAQDVDKAAQKINYDFSGVDKSGSIMGLRYSDFVVPLVKAVQELSSENDALKKNYDVKIDALQKQIEELKTIIVSNQSTADSQMSTGISSSSLSQNIPNPFSNTTTINYSIPQQFNSARISVTDKSGNVIKTINISGGKGNVKIDASTLSSGAYQYSLYVNNKLVDTKQMVSAK